MIKENLVNQFDTSHYDIYTINEAADVYAIQLNENIPAMLQVSGVEKAELKHRVTTFVGGKTKEWIELKYIIAGKGTAYPGEWLVWNGSYLAVMTDARFKQKYKLKRAKE